MDRFIRVSPGISGQIQVKTDFRRQWMEDGRKLSAKAEFAVIPVGGSPTGTGGSPVPPSQWAKIAG